MAKKPKKDTSKTIGVRCTTCHVPAEKDADGDYWCPKCDQKMAVEKDETDKAEAPKT